MAQSTSLENLPRIPQDRLNRFQHREDGSEDSYAQDGRDSGGSPQNTSSRPTTSIKRKAVRNTEPENAGQPYEAVATRNVPRLHLEDDYESVQNGGSRGYLRHE